MQVADFDRGRVAAELPIQRPRQLGFPGKGNPGRFQVDKQAGIRIPIAGEVIQRGLQIEQAGGAAHQHDFK